MCKVEAYFGITAKIITLNNNTFKMECRILNQPETLHIIEIVKQLFLSECM